MRGNSVLDICVHLFPVMLVVRKRSFMRVVSQKRYTPVILNPPTCMHAKYISIVLL